MFNLPNPGNNPANPFYSRIIAEQQRALQEAVTVDIEFKKDADGAAAIGSETGRRGLVVSGKKVKDKVYKITFTNNATMNKFMDKYENKLNEGTEELEEGTPEYRAMMKKYKGSDMEKVFKILDKEGFRMGEQSDTLVRNMLKKHRGNVKKAADQIMKDNPGMFDVNRMMMDDVQIDEAYEVTFQFKGSKTKFMSRVKEFQNSGAMTGFSELDKRIEGRPNMVKMTFKSKNDFNKFFSQGVSGGVVKVQENIELDEMSAKAHYNKMKAQGKIPGMVVSPIDRKRFPNREREGLEGPFRVRRTGLIYYYDRKAGKYYDPQSDMYLEVNDIMETNVIDNIDDYLAEGND